MAISTKSVNLPVFLSMVRAAADMERQACRSHTPIQGIWTLDESEGLWHHLWTPAITEMLTILETGEDECGLSYDLFDNGSKVLIPEGLGEYLDNPKTHPSQNKPQDVPVVNTKEDNNMTTTLTDRDDFRRALSYEDLATSQMSRKNLLIAREDLMLAFQEHGVDFNIHIIGITNKDLARWIRIGSRKLKKLIRGKKEEKSMRFGKTLKIYDGDILSKRVDQPTQEISLTQTPLPRCWVSDYLVGQKEEDMEFNLSENVDAMVELMFKTATRGQQELARGRAKSIGFTKKLVGVCFNPSKGNTQRVMFRYNSMVGPEGLIEKLYGQQYPLPVIQLLNKQKEDANGDQPPVPRAVLRGALQAGYVLVKDKWLIRKEIADILRKTFEEWDAKEEEWKNGDINMRGYVNGLCAPMIHMDQYEVCLKAHSLGHDGAATVHPDHPIVKDMGLTAENCGAFQIRGWDPDTGVLVKGLLYLSMDAVDENGNPAICPDWEQVKGRHKKLAQQRMSEDATTKMYLYVGVMHHNQRIEKQWLGAQQLQFVADNEQNRGYVDGWVQDFFDKLSLERLMKSAIKQDDHTARIVRFLEACGENPLSNPLVQEVVNDKLSRRLYRVAQGAGLRGYRLYCVMDERLQPGTAMMAPIKTDKGWKFLPGSRIAASRSPGIDPNCLADLVLVEADEEHMIKVNEEYTMPWMVIFVHPSEADRMQLDDDGDKIVLFDDRRVLNAWDSKIQLFGGENDVYLIEPEKGGENVIGGHEWGSDAWLNFVADSGKGNIGMTTLVEMMWIALNDYTEVPGSMMHLQVTVDQEKRATRLCELGDAADPANWHVAGEYDRVCDAEGNTVHVKCWKYQGEYMADNHWALDRNGLYKDDKIFALAGQRTKAKGFMSELYTDKQGNPVGVKPTEVLTWRNSRKSHNMDDWFEPEYTGERQNLVHYCARKAWEAFQVWKQENLPPKMSKRLSLVLFDKIGMSAQPIPEESYVKGLRIESGIKAYRDEIGSIMRKLNEDVNREAMFSSAEANFVLALKQLSEEQLLQIWATELMLANQYLSDKTQRDAHLKLAFQAVVWDGSPIMAKLGASDEDEGCTFMNADRLARTEALARYWLAKKDESNMPLFKDIHEVLDRLLYGPWGEIVPGIDMPQPIAHLRVTGKSISQCKTCRNAILGMAVRIGRATPDERMESRAKWLVKCVGAELRK